MSTRRTFVLLSAVLLAGCSNRLNLGDSLLWSADHETGDLAEWTKAGKGGYSADSPDTAYAVSAEVAHSGTYSIKLTNGAVSDYETAGLWRQDDYPDEAYYSAWYYLPRSFQTTADWTIMRFRVPGATDAATTLGWLIDIELRSLPSGDMILSVFDHRGDYLRSPTPDPAQLVPIGEWFHLEAFYRNVADDSGRLTVWLNGNLNYDIQRPFGLGQGVYWSVCSSTYGLSPTSSTLYVDDAAVSLVRVTPEGSIR